MYHAVMSGAFHGMESFLVQVEVDVSNGLPGMDMVGCLASEVKETKERVRVGLKNSGFDLPVKRITVSLSPADIRKDGSGFDLPVALGILGATLFSNVDTKEMDKANKMINCLDGKSLDEKNSDTNLNQNMDNTSQGNQYKNTEKRKETDVIVLGEIGLDGVIKGIRGILPILLKASENKITKCILPYQNRFEASNVKGITLYPVKTLQEAFAVYTAIKQENIVNVTGDINKNKNDSDVSVLKKYEYVQRLCDKSASDEIGINNTNNTNNSNKNELDFWQVVGQEHAKRAAMIAAAGFHNLLLFGPPGSGKSMIAQRMPTIMQSLQYEECLDITKIYSVAGLLEGDTALITKRPFMSPHHTVSEAALVGGGITPRPGMITLAHKGILFLDELPEFGRVKLDLLRQPLEEKVIQISRMNYTCKYQADFMLVAAMNPCPCGFYPDRNKCTCSPHEIKRYLNRISGPLLDRMDISVEVGRMEWEQVIGTKELREVESVRRWDSAYMKKQVEHAILCQMERNQGKYNSALSGEELDRICIMDRSAEQFLKFIFEKMQLSMRSVIRLKKVARTIADLEDAERISKQHISEAVMLNKGLERLKNKRID